MSSKPKKNAGLNESSTFLLKLFCSYERILLLSRNVSVFIFQYDI